MQVETQRYEVRLARDADEIRAAQRLRYIVFVEERGAEAAEADHEARLEKDAFDAHFDHLLLIDHAAPRDGDLHVVGVYRLLRGAVAQAGPGFYGQHEYDLDPLLRLDREVVELGRSCVHPAHRGGAAMHLLWQGLGAYVIRNGIGIMFGVASFPGTDVAALAQPLSHLHHAHLAPPELRVRTLDRHHVDMDILPPEAIDRREAMRMMPPLIKAYLRLGGVVGDGAYVDRDFNTVDVCLLMDTARMTARYRDMYSRNVSA
ncbi:GNAT family N-acetyltransferase [Roseobacter sp. HKCCA0434]|uniref:GNAT family N-acetyltransferase n=1 Tax=Roseobacter sp. HKCCA0434 TaxID=3079297 RepID=UPI00290589E6|nr:GNAT family N-acyltransferase [Roseobacter sp. HKCCA0434]